MFVARYNAVRHESISNYRPHPNRKVLACEICVKTAANSSSTPTNSQCDTKQEFFVFNVGAARSRNCHCKYMDCIIPSKGATNDERREGVLEATDLLLKVCRH